MHCLQMNDYILLNTYTVQVFNTEWREQWGDMKETKNVHHSIGENIFVLGVQRTIAGWHLDLKTYRALCSSENPRY